MKESYQLSYMRLYMCKANEIKDLLIIVSKLRLAAFISYQRFQNTLSNDKSVKNAIIGRNLHASFFNHFNFVVLSVAVPSDIS